MDMTGEIKRRIEELKHKAERHYEQMIVCNAGAKALESILDEAARRAKEGQGEDQDNQG